MGNSLACFYPTQPTKTSKASPKELFPPWLTKSTKLQSTPPSSSTKPDPIFDESYIKKQAQIATMLYHQHLQINGGDDDHVDLLRSMSTKNPPSSYKKPKKLSQRSRSLSCSTSVSTLQLPNHQDVARSEDSKHFVLVHGGGFGAWCWYKIIALLKEAKYEVDAIDLTGSGSNYCDINSIKTLAQYANPLTHFLANLHDSKKKVILVGHDLGGVSLQKKQRIPTEFTDGLKSVGIYHGSKNRSTRPSTPRVLAPQWLTEASWSNSVELIVDRVMSDYSSELTD
ncbi:hypothetical protein CASFOL_024229 [Castilleja foliolosa]|uniref:AB hydrolase-1 domain-containing protein n=1 Tax=Castilleja foliolosa TaxID=1961234 RepID=A0ABD3CMP4_9LAMI